VQAQRIIDEGEFQQAIEYIEQYLPQYPDSDPLLALYGEALYENKQISEAEEVFRRALEINPLNALAARRIEVIRAINDASVSEQAQQLEEITLDKVFDLFRWH
jgi:tetratricopeptide (TPR) repeat protein